MQTTKRTELKTVREDIAFKELLGCTFTAVEVVDGDIIFTDFMGPHFRMCHHADCCESVEIDDICGDLTDLCNNPILLAEETTNRLDPARTEDDDSYTWTFYRLATIKGSVVIRWYGTSNGYYSEEVSLDEVEEIELPPLNSGILFCRTT